MIDYYFIFRIVRKISTDFKNWEAYRNGVIDDKGAILVKPVNRTPLQKRSFDKIDLISLKLRRMLLKANIPANPTTTLAAALWLIKEAQETDYSSMLNEEVDKNVSFLVYMEQFLYEEDGGGEGGAPSTNTSAMIGYPDPDIGPRLKTIKRKRKAECDE